MNESSSTDREQGELSREEMMSALFAHMVIQHSNMAMMLLGKVPNPQTGQPIRDMEAARLFIDELEMLETKTKGNLSRQEEQLLKQSLTTLRLTYVEESQSPEAEQPAAPASQAHEAASPPESSEPDAEGKKKFSKKY